MIGQESETALLKHSNLVPSHNFRMLVNGNGTAAYWEAGMGGW